MQFLNKTALVTGAAGGIGRDIAAHLAGEGADLVLVDINREELERVNEQVRQLGRKSLPLYSDVTSKQAADRVFAQVQADFGRLDILVNLVGINIYKPAVELSEEDWDYLTDVNLKSMFLYSQLAGAMMLRQKSGVIINISSIYGLGGIPRRLGYACGKSAVNSLTQTLACEWAMDGVRVNAIAPGYILTEQLQKYFDQKILTREHMLSRTPQGRLGTPGDIARAVAFLASEQNSFITGSVLYVDGGYSAYRGAEPVPYGQ